MSDNTEAPRSIEATDDQPVLLALSPDHAATLRRVLARAVDRAVTPEQEAVFESIYEQVLDAHAAARRAARNCSDGQA